MKCFKLLWINRLRECFKYLCGQPLTAFTTKRAMWLITFFGVFDAVLIKGTKQKHL